MVNSNSFRNLSHADLQHILLTCELLHQFEPEQSFLPHCQATLDGIFACVHHSTELYTLTPFALSELENPTINGHWLDVFNQHMHEHPYVSRMLSGQPSHLEAVQQEKNLESFKKTALYNEFYDKVQGQNHLWLAYRNDTNLLSCVFLREAEFNERELSMASIIHPHVESAWKNWSRMRSFKQELDSLKGSVFQTPEQEIEAALIRSSIESLTARQREVVEQVASGKDNQQIADELKISVLTVKKHLQAIFLSLEVRHRTQLAAKWHQAHSISIY
ncbi:helix-turn-helix transcriptional regulator [Pontiella agarivorans]|uniref:Helix-turn-helix transcriptional regulator n=1 Tax=Pontiella agarivorans TaxID=3038953 RepID=A0ABU5N0J1_9BACT|nr:helix-turn-helix transcriptional regulator [Pontiella agarivorans]MDZ8119953.1 helix-turn-helix transcriptional regulator [Pontiella agarivorans]